MADQPITKEKLIKADIDVENLGKAANEKVVINPRYGDPYKSVPLLVDELQNKADQVVAQGFYQGYTTEALLLVAKPNVAEMRARADDTRKIWRWIRTSAEGVTPITGTWIDTGLSDLDQAKNYAVNYTDIYANKSFEQRQFLSSQFLAIAPVRSNGAYSSYTTSTSARTCLIQVEPDTEYLLIKKQAGLRFLVIENSDYPFAQMPNTVIRTVNDDTEEGVVSGNLIFKTSDTAKWITVTASVFDGLGFDLIVRKLKPVNGMFVKSRNLANPIYTKSKAVISYTSETENPFSPSGFNGYTGFFEVKKNQQYTVSLSEPTSRFRVVLMNVSAQGVRTYTNITSADGSTTVTFTTGANVILCAVYYTHVGQTPDVQLNEGGVIPAEPYGYKLSNEVLFSQSEGLPVLVIDPLFDITAQLQSAFARSANSIVYISPGTYGFNKTLNIPSNAKILGLGEVVLQLTSTSDLETVTWRNLQVKTYLKSSEGSVNAYLENIKIVGADLDTTSLHFGICMQGVGHELKDVSTDHINFEVTNNAERRAGGNGWGLVFYKAKSCKVKGGEFTYGGYENIGTDNAEDITFEDIYCGAGWRTSFQVHRNCKNITLINPTIEQTVTSEAQTHAALTIHGTPTEPVRSLKVLGGTIKAQVGAQSPDGRGAVQSVEGNEHDVMLQGVTIISNKNGVVSSTNQPNKVEKWIVTGCDIDAVLDTVVIKGKHSAVTGNVLKGQRTAQFTGDEATTCIEANNVFIPVS